MIEVEGDLWKVNADVKCITTNGYVKKDGTSVMGAGVAKQAARRWPLLPKIHGLLLSGLIGNHVCMLGGPPWLPFTLYAFPVKENWWEKADLELIKRSARELVHWIEMEPTDDKILLPRPGCGNGGLTWEEVKPIIEPILDDRFHIIDLPKSKVED